MTSNKTTRRALFSSVMSLLLCCSMLLGTTFAWFTDSVTSTGNIIKSGTLDVEMSWCDTNSTTESDWKDAAAGAIFDYKFWEPGYTQVKYVKIKNVGDLSFQYKLTIDPAIMPAAGEANLADVIDAYLVPAAQAPADRAAVDAFMAANEGATITELIADPDGAAYGVMVPAPEKQADGLEIPAGADVGEATYCIILHMQEEAGNEYQNLTVGEGFSVHLLATQVAAEIDSFDIYYDADTAYSALPASASVARSAITGGTVGGVAGYEFDIMSVADSSVKVASVVVVPASLAADADEFSILIKEGTASANITVAANQQALGYEIAATGLDPNNTEPVKVELFVGAGLTDAVVYRYDELLSRATYDPISGYVTFATTSFSPFTVVVSTDEFVLPETNLPEGIPVATVTDVDEYENTDLEWGSYSQWSPTAGLSSQLEAAYKFVCPDTAETAAASDYAQWKCDFYVKLDRDLGENQIFLGGNYGSFGWVGFHNGDLTLDANTEIALLGSVTNNGWTYEAIASNVGTFICGVGDVNNALSGATFTVMLRLTNPKNDSEYYNVNTVEYTFQ